MQMRELNLKGKFYIFLSSFFFKYAIFKFCWKLYVQITQSFFHTRLAYRLHNAHIRQTLNTYTHMFLFPHCRAFFVIVAHPHIASPAYCVLNWNE